MIYNNTGEIIGSETKIYNVLGTFLSNVEEISEVSFDCIKLNEFIQASGDTKVIVYFNNSKLKIKKSEINWYLIEDIEMTIKDLEDSDSEFIVYNFQIIEK